jgi:hypothetical protein
MSRSFALASVVVLGTALAVPSFADGGKHWVATWATSPATFFVYTAPVVPVYPPGAPTTFAPANIQPDLVFPFPDAATTGATANNQTFRSIIKPDLWGSTMRFRFSNTFGSQPVTFSAVTVGLQEIFGQCRRRHDGAGDLRRQPVGGHPRRPGNLERRYQAHMGRWRRRRSQPAGAEPRRLLCHCRR